MTKTPKKPFDIEDALRMLSQMEALFDSTLTPEQRAEVAVMRRQAERQFDRETGVYAAGEDAQASEDFELLTFADALESLADKIHAGVKLKEAAIYQKVLDVYYTTEELAKDPANAHLQEHVEKMREAHQKQYGKPIPPKKKS